MTRRLGSIVLVGLLAALVAWPQATAVGATWGDSPARNLRSAVTATSLASVQRPMAASPVSEMDMRRKAVRLCAGWGYKKRLHQATIISADYTGDGVDDGLAAFSCIPKQESEYDGFVAYWTTDESAMSPEGLLFRQADLILIDKMTLAGSQVKVAGSGWDTKVKAEAGWRADRWVTRGIKIVPTTDW